MLRAPSTRWTTTTSDAPPARRDLLRQGAYHRLVVLKLAALTIFGLGLLACSTKVVVAQKGGTTGATRHRQACAAARTCGISLKLALAALALASGASCYAGNCDAIGCPETYPLVITIHGVSPAPDATHNYVLTVVESGFSATCSSAADASFDCQGSLTGLAVSFANGSVLVQLYAGPPQIECT